MEVKRYIRIISEVDSDEEISKKGIKRFIAVETLRGEEYRHGMTFAHKVGDRYLLYANFPIRTPLKFPSILIPVNAHGLVNQRLEGMARECASKIPFAEVKK